MSKTGMNLDELQTAKAQAQEAYLLAYIESIKTNVPALLELADQIEKAQAEARERARENPDAEAWAKGENPD